MTFISYAQNLEDVMLWRVFKDIENGFYIDVGAHDPVVDSVTKAFYDRNWKGINIEPLQKPYQTLVDHRPRDINLNVAVSDKGGVSVFYAIDGLSTLSKTIAESHKKNNIDYIAYPVSTLTLEQICEDCVKHNSIHFLKIDVEGVEKDVLFGMNFKKFRPWVVVIEATLPNSQEENYQEWEFILLQHHYQFVYFDGLNRFYLAKEHIDLASKFSAPPNVFDYYLRYDEVVKNNVEKHLRDYFQLEKMQSQSQKQILGLEKNIQALKNNIQIRDEINNQLEKKINIIKDLLHKILHSKSWKYTRILRAISARLNKRPMAHMSVEEVFAPTPIEVQTPTLSGISLPTENTDAHKILNQTHQILKEALHV